MRIALVGYGKMGHAIERIAIARGHEIVLRITSGNKEEMNIENMQLADAAIEFTNPAAAKENVLKCLDAGIAVVCGTTGWNNEVEEAQKRALQKNTSFLQTSNFSIGVNIFFEVNKLLASLMNRQPDYDVKIEETHHVHKKDAPSGTAITIAEQIIADLERKQTWGNSAATYPGEIAITAYREEDVPGTHLVKYSSTIDDIEIVHTAHNRDGFALGAVLAAEYIAGRRGIFTMQDVLGINH
ncbi:MAG: 4-hydroxy-tetrahydrodipicolinate reductase [Taibaiella sp.]|nr:4-hydroxy-tetrahydrodipicolinate reductase [Taibaiella sp.]